MCSSWEHFVGGFCMDVMKLVLHNLNEFYWIVSTCVWLWLQMCNFEVYFSDSENDWSWLLQEVVDDKSALVQVMAWWRQATFSKQPFKLMISRSILPGHETSFSILVADRPFFWSVKLTKICKIVRIYSYMIFNCYQKPWVIIQHQAITWTNID